MRGQGGRVRESWASGVALYWQGKGDSAVGLFRQWPYVRSHLALPDLTKSANGAVISADRTLQRVIRLIGCVGPLRPHWLPPSPR